MAGVTGFEIAVLLQLLADGLGTAGLAKVA
jgi:hypothetical protein